MLTAALLSDQVATSNRTASLHTSISLLQLAQGIHLGLQWCLAQVMQDLPMHQHQHMAGHLTTQNNSNAGCTVSLSALSAQQLVPVRLSLCLCSQELHPWGTNQRFLLLILTCTSSAYAAELTYHQSVRVSHTTTTAQRK